MFTGLFSTILHFFKAFKIISLAYSILLAYLVYVLTTIILKGQKERFQQLNLKTKLNSDWNHFTQALDKYLFLLKWRNVFLG